MNRGTASHESDKAASAGRPLPGVDTMLGVTVSDDDWYRHNRLALALNIADFSVALVRPPATPREIAQECLRIAGRCAASRPVNSDAVEIATICAAVLEDVAELFRAAATQLVGAH